MNAPPLVTVIIPTFNRREKLQRALTSVFKQSRGDFEVLVIDNGSSDGTQEFIQSVTDLRLRYIRNKDNAGACRARNIGIENARASLIAFLDDDDSWYEQKLSLQVQKMKDCPLQVGLVYAASEVYDEQKQTIRTIHHPKFKGRVYQHLLMGNILGLNTVLIRKECFQKVGMFDEQLSSCQDWDMWLRVASAYEFDYVDEVLDRINMHGAQISTDYSALIPGRTGMVQKHWKEFEAHPKIFVIHLKRLGKLHCLNGTWSQAWGWFAKAISLRPAEVFKIFAWLVLELPWTKFFSQSKQFKRYRP